jgi:hypothetical protein
MQPSAKGPLDHGTHPKGHLHPVNRRANLQRFGSSRAGRTPTTRLLAPHCGVATAEMLGSPSMTRRTLAATRAATLNRDAVLTELPAKAGHNSNAAKAPPGLSPDLAVLFEEMLASAPRFIDRSSAAKLVTDHLYRLSPRTIESWALPTRILNGRANFETGIFLLLVFAKLVAAPVVMGGKRSDTPQHQPNPASRPSHPRNWRGCYRPLIGGEREDRNSPVL